MKGERNEVIVIIQVMEKEVQYYKEAAVSVALTM